MPFLEPFNRTNYLADDPETSIGCASAITGIGFVRGVRSYVMVVYRRGAVAEVVSRSSNA